MKPEEIFPKLEVLQKYLIFDQFQKTSIQFRDIKEIYYLSYKDIPEILVYNRKYLFKAENAWFKDYFWYFWLSLIIS